MKKHKIEKEKIDLENMLKKIDEMYKLETTPKDLKTAIESLTELKAGNIAVEYLRRLNIFVLKQVEENSALKEHYLEIYMYVIKCMSMGFKQNYYYAQKQEEIYSKICDRILEFTNKLELIDANSADLIYDIYGQYFIVGRKYSGFPNIRVDLAARFENQAPEVIEKIDKAEKDLNKPDLFRKDKVPVSLKKSSTNRPKTNTEGR